MLTEVLKGFKRGPNYQSGRHQTPRWTRISADFARASATGVAVPRSTSCWNTIARTLAASAAVMPPPSGGASGRRGPAAAGGADDVGGAGDAGGGAAAGGAAGRGAVGAAGAAGAEVARLAPVSADLALASAAPWAEPFAGAPP